MTIVREFHLAFEQPAPDHPTLPDEKSVFLRMKLINEEHKEVHNDLADLIRATRRGEPVEKRLEILRRLLKELADLRYVLEGTAVAFGLDIDGAFEETHRSNMSKLGEDGRPIRREDGKALKGPNYSPADMTIFIPEVIDHDETA